MSANAAALIAKLGLDSGDFQKGLAQAEQRAAATTKRTAAAKKEATDRWLENDKKVERSAAALAQTILRGGSAAEVFAQAADSLENSLQSALGVGVAATVGVVVIQRLAAAKEASDALHKSIRALLDGSVSADFSTLDQIGKRLDDLRAKAAELNQFSDVSSGKGIWGTLGDFGKHIIDFASSSHLLGGSGYDAVETQRQRDLEALRKAEATALDAAATKQERLAAIQEMRLKISGRAAEMEKIGVEYAERLGRVRDTLNAKEYAAVRRQRDLALEEAAARFDAADRATALEARLLEIKREGRDVEVETARAKLDAARAAYNAPQTAEDRAKAANALAAAQQEYNQTVKVSAERQFQYELEKKIAGMIATADEKRRAQLEAENARLRERLATATPDEALGLDSALGKNLEAIRAIDDARRIREQEAFEKFKRDEFEVSQAAYEESLDQTRVGIAREFMTIDERRASLAEEIEKRRARIAQLEKDTSDYAAQAAAAEREKVQHLSAQTLQLQSQRADMSKLSLGELSAYGSGRTRAVADRYERLMEQSRRAAGRAGRYGPDGEPTPGSQKNLDRAAKLRDRAAELAASLPSLKDADKQQLDVRTISAVTLEVKAFNVANE